MKRRFARIFPIVLITLLPTLLIWLPFFLRLKSFWGIPLGQEGMATIVANYDGPLYLVIAKTLYNLDLIKSNFQFPLPLEYYAAHFPLFPLFIRIFGFFISYPYSMLFITLFSSFMALYFFYKLAGEYLEENDALWLTFVFSILPARWLIVRSVGSAEPLFLAGTIASIYYFKKRRYVASGVWGAIAQLTKSPGILIFASFLLIYLYPKIKKVFSLTFLKPTREIAIRQILPIFFIPFSLLCVFFVYKVTFNNFFAYFASGDNIHLFFPPFQIFNYASPWVGTFWLEEIIFVYLFGVLGLLKLIEKKDFVLALFVGIFFVSTLFVSHRDLIRYSLPIVPFILIAFSETLIKKEFRVVIAVLILPTYLFSLAYISQNVMPISNWAPFL